MWLFGSAILPPGIVLFGALGGWGGKFLPWTSLFSGVQLAVAIAAAAAEGISLRRADPYGEATRRGVLALEAIAPSDSADSRLTGMWRSLRSGGRRPAAYFPIDWMYKTVEEFGVAMERLARYAVRSGDPVGRARRERETRFYVAHLQEAVERYRTAALAHRTAPRNDGASAAARGEAHARLLSLIAQVLVQLVNDDLAVPPLDESDLPEDRRNALTIEVQHQTVWQGILAASALIAIAVLFAWAKLPTEFTTPVLLALGGVAGVLLPRARWPQ